MSKTAGVVLEAGTVYSSQALAFTPGFLVVRVTHLFSFFVLSYYVSLRSEFREVRYDFRI